MTPITRDRAAFAALIIIAAAAYFISGANWILAAIAVALIAYAAVAIVGRLGIGLTVLVIAAIVGIGYFLLAKGGFSDADIAATKVDIRAKFEERNGVSVSDVILMRDGANSKKLIGFVKLRVQGIELTKSCSATMGDGGNYIWECP